MSAVFKTTDLVLRDSRTAATVFIVSALALLGGAVIGLNTWPGQSFLVGTRDHDLRSLLFSFQTFPAIFIALFWGALPQRRLVFAVLIGWLVTTVAALAAVPGALEMVWPEPKTGSWYLFFSATLAVPCLAASLWRVSARSHDDTALQSKLRWLIVLTMLFIFVPQPLLSLGATLQPSTFDAYALHWDRAAGLDLTPALTRWIESVPYLPQWVTFAYGVTPLVFLAVPLLQLRRKPQHVASALLLWVVMTACAVIAYQFFPVTGPKYVFGAERFLDILGGSDNVPLQRLLVDPFPRNGMPSMHFGWLLAGSILWWQAGTRWWSRAVMLAMTALTVLATLYLGEHYTIDLIVAVPFVLASIAASSTGVPWQGSSRLRVVLAGFGCWLAWVLLLRFQIDALVSTRILCLAAVAATVVVVAWQVRWMRRFADEVRTEASSPMAVASAAALDTRRLELKFGAMFFASGAAALIYQVLFSKELALVFGSTATATITVLATFLGGMAIGSLIGGAVAHRSRRPLVLYAFIELGIGVYCVATPTLFDLIQQAYVFLATGAPPDAPMLLLLRVLLGASVLLVPTVLMGITLPLLAQALGPQSGRMGSRAAWLYFANTAGAAAGALVSAYVIIPALGAHRTTLIAAALNLLVALAALELFKRLGAAAAPADGGTHADEPAATRASNEWSPAVRAMALTVLALGGFLSLGLEVVYVHLLAIVAGNSVYAFGLMLSTFLIGLSIGGETARRLVLQRGANTAEALVLSLLALSAAVALGSWGWNAIPEYFASYSGYPLARDFGTREAIRGVVCGLVMIPPTLFIGSTYVLAMDIVTSSSRKPRAQSLGLGSALNTAGNIGGVLVFGFVLLPLWGGLGSTHAVAAAALGLALLALGVLRPGGLGRVAQLRTGVASLATLGVLVASLSHKLDYAALSSGSNVYFTAQQWGVVIDHAESIDGGLTTVARRDEPAPTVRTLLTNGKFQGNDALDGEMQAQLGFALAPLLHQEKRGSALVIGYGSGATSRVFHEAGFAHLDIAELSHDIVRLADRHFESVNRRVSQARGVQLHVTDGRNMLLLGEGRRYDVISIEISSIWFAGAASLYNQEFYRLVRSRLADDGVLQQWVQLHRLAPTDILTIVATLRSEFRFVSLYVIGGQGILVASNHPGRAEPSRAAIKLLQDSHGLADVRAIIRKDAHALVGDRMLDAPGIDRFVAAGGGDASLWLSTDDNLRLEYSTPRANVNDAERSARVNHTMLAKHRSP